jgi:hypothetical protein
VALKVADLQAFLARMDKEDEPSGFPPITINITLPDMAQSMQRMFGTPDGESLRVRDGVSPRP